MPCRSFRSLASLNKLTARNGSNWSILPFFLCAFLSFHFFLSSFLCFLFVLWLLDRAGLLQESERFKRVRLQFRERWPAQTMSEHTTACFWRGANAQTKRRARGLLARPNSWICAIRSKDIESGKKRSKMSISLKHAKSYCTQGCSLLANPPAL